MSTLKVNGIRHTGASSDAITTASDGTCTVKATNNLSNRNLIINGDMQIAQRGTSSTSDGYHTVDRFAFSYGGENEAPTQAQHVLTSSDTGPWEKGFRHSFHITNGNQTGGAGAADYAYIDHKLESQDLATCGWDYTSASSYITLSFWIKSSVAQNFYGFLLTFDSTDKIYAFETGALSANTWTKITKVIAGSSSGPTFDNDHNIGMLMRFSAFMGTNETGTKTLNQWDTADYAARTPDQPSGWWTTNNATLEMTGVQFEVGDVATEYEHRKYGDELARCQRYFWKSFPHDVAPAKNLGNADSIFFPVVSGYNGSIAMPVSMRTDPTCTFYNPSANNNDNSSSGSVAVNRSTSNGIFIEWGNVAGNSYTQITASAEL